MDETDWALTTKVRRAGETAHDLPWRERTALSSPMIYWL